MGMDEEEIQEEMGADTQEEHQQSFSDVYEEQGDETSDKDSADGGMKSVEKGVVWYSKEEKSHVHLREIWNKAADHDQGDILFRGFPGDPSHEGMSEPVSHLVSSVQTDRC